jgi:hypothetical protein
MISWEDFVTRRNIDFEKFKISHGIENERDLLRYCHEFNLEPPDERKLSSLFPPKKVPDPAPQQQVKVEQAKKTKGAKKK